MTSILAAARPDSVNFPLFVHVLGAMILVGGLVTATSALALAKGDTARIALIVGGIGMRRLRDGKGQGLLKATLVISVVILAAALVAVWAMAGKPN